MDWIRLLYSSSESCILNCGMSSGWFPFGREVQQGCPISPFLFVLAAEKLADVLRRDPLIKGIDLLESHSGLGRALQTIERFKRISGLGLNLHKSQGIVIGDLEIQSDLAKAIPWGDSFQILGINFDTRNYENKDILINFDPALVKMKKVCDSWSMRNLSLKGKTVILNTLVLPIISYQCAVLTTSNSILKEVDNLFFSMEGQETQNR